MNKPICRYCNNCGKDTQVVDGDCLTCGETYIEMKQAAKPCESEVKPKPKCYYARPISIDNTPQYERDVALIESMGYEVNPSPEEKIEILKEYKIVGMTAFRRSVTGSNCLFFRAFLDGKIGAGVALEIEWAEEYGIPVLEIPRQVRIRSLDVDTTREYLAELGQR